MIGQRAALAHSGDVSAAADVRRRPDVLIVVDPVGVLWTVPAERFEADGVKLPGGWNRWEVAHVDSDPTPPTGMLRPALFPGPARPFDWQLDAPEVIG